MPPPPPAQGLWAQRPAYARERWRPDDEALRSRNILWLGIVLLAGFLLPMVIPMGRETKVIFPNFLILGEEDAPALLKFMFLYPGLAGVAVMVLASTCQNIGRSVTLMALGILPFVLLAADEDVQRGLREMANALGPSQGALVLFALLNNSPRFWIERGAT